MSTRRARIKAVTSLPPRRKNNDGAEKAKPKILEKDDGEKVQSPRTPRGSVKVQDNLEKKSPKPASSLLSPRAVNNVVEKVPSPKVTTASPIKSPHSISNNKQLTDKIGSPTTTIVNTKEVATPKISEKVSVITSIFNAKPNVFASPRGYSPRKHVASPLARQTSNVEVSIQRLTPITPEKAPDKSKENMLGIDKTDGNSKELYKDANTSISVEVTRGDVSDDYNVPSVPESITEDTVMDGIVPLQPVSNAPKPLALLKNEIISENAEVLFDPIVPLPSPSKVRTKLRPVPRLAPLRRNSVQGSASESEDENRRALLSGGGSSTPAPSRQRHDSHTSHSTMLSLPNREVSRIRNDSLCSSVSQATAVPLAAASPVKEKHTKSRRLDMSRRMAAMRRRRETVKKDALTMYDLIFYNPTSNPIIPDQDEINAKEANEKQEAVRKASQDTEVVSKPQPETDAAPVPQIKLGPNGEIMLDEQSLVIKQSETRKVSSNVVHEGAWGNVSSGRYRRTPRTADWSDAETVRFYRALAALGTDFMLMERLFPGRTRRDLKLKFKKEERLNMAQVDKALRTTSRWDATKLLEEFEAEREAAERRARAEAEQLREHAREMRQRQKEVKEARVRQSRGAKALGCSVVHASVQSKVDTTCSADELIRRHHEAKARKRKTKQPAPSPPQPKTSTPQSTSTPEFATLTLNNKTTAKERRNTNSELATILKLDPTKLQGKTPDLKQTPTQVPVVPSNIESGSLVVLTVNDPNSPSKKMLQTYIAQGGGQLTPIALPASFLNSVVTYMKKGEKTPKSISAGSSPRLASPASVASQDSRPSSTPGVIQLTGASPAKRQRHSSYTITQL